MSDIGLLNKLEQIAIKYEEIAKQMVDPDIISDMKRYVRLNQEYKDLTVIVNTYKEYKDVLNNIVSTKDVIQTEEDQEFKEMAKLELEDFLQKKMNWMKK
jgi:peptide chain release factor 1